MSTASTPARFRPSASIAPHRPPGSPRQPPRRTRPAGAYLGRRAPGDAAAARAGVDWSRSRPASRSRHRRRRPPRDPRALPSCDGGSRRRGHLLPQHRAGARRPRSGAARRRDIDRRELAVRQSATGRHLRPANVEPGSVSSLHTKCVVVNGRWPLVNSANFTDRGLYRNLEAGVLIEDSTFASRWPWLSLVPGGQMKPYIPAEADD